MSSSALNGSIMNATDNSIFTAVIEDYSLLMGILREMEQVNDCSLLRVSDVGLRFITVSRVSPSTQVSTFFPKSTFTKFHLNDDDGFDYRFDLRDFIAAVTFMDFHHSSSKESKGNNFVYVNENTSTQSSTRTSSSRRMGPPSLYMQYRGKAQPLLLKLETVNNIDSRSELRGFEQKLAATLAYPTNDRLFEITLNSNRFHDMVQGLDFNSDFIFLNLRPSDIVLKMATDSRTLGIVELEIAEKSPVLANNEPIICPPDVEAQVTTNCYRTTFLKPALQALSNSSRVIIRCNKEGLLCLEHIKNIGPSNGNGGGQRQCSVEYYISPDVGNIENESFSG